MNPQFYYQQPQSGSDWVKQLKEPPFSYILIFLAIAVSIYLIFALPNYGARILILLIAFPVHELAHAMTAYRLGDPTPKNDGRITLNPFAHLDLFGSILILMAGLGWAKPVRFQPGNLNMDPRTGSMIVAIAGPVSNLLMALFVAAIWNGAIPFLQMVGISLPVQMLNLLYFFIFINVALFFFNLIPLAPLDGFMVLRGILPREMVQYLDKIQPYSMMIFLALFFFSRQLPIFDWLVFTPAISVTRLILFNI